MVVAGTRAPAPASLTQFPTASNASNPCDDANVPQTIDAVEVRAGGFDRRPGDSGDQPDGGESLAGALCRSGWTSTTLLPVCGIVVAPDAAGKVALNSGTGNMLAWSHGTIGLSENCQPSNDPAKLIFGPQAGGIGAVSFGSQTAGTLHQGTAQNGVLQTVINRGWTVAATDYYAGGLSPSNKNTMPYVVASMSGAAVLDSTRAAAQVLAAQYGPALAAKAYNVVTWGHSQGGHSAFWAAQLGRSYFAKTAPKQYTPSLKVVGTAVLAPASTFVAGPDDPQLIGGRTSVTGRCTESRRRRSARSASGRRSGSRCSPSSSARGRSGGPRAWPRVRSSRPIRAVTPTSRRTPS